MTAARKYSKDPTTKRAGGALGYFTRGKMVHEFSDVAFDMKVGDISQPVKSQYGWHLILVEDKREMTPFAPRLHRRIRRTWRRRRTCRRSTRRTRARPWPPRWGAPRPLRR